MDVLPKTCHKFSLHGSFEYQFDSVQGNLQLGKPSHGKQMTMFFEGCHVFYDPVVEYMENLGNGNRWLYLYYKYQFICDNLLPLSLSSLFLIKHEEET